ncbi:hypothetical protein Anapl_04076 [Anas platyrhynchos]|uniref:Uncharacterized protein n=1 Tax=Anas platyrhynchos TaxID=8839 RepID=R0LCS5_ANAPL|nr:hypothetical protein Anapl_04076 [Anas platyrhynchos]
MFSAAAGVFVRVDTCTRENKFLRLLLPWLLLATSWFGHRVCEQHGTKRSLREQGCEQSLW